MLNLSGKGKMKMFFIIYLISWMQRNNLQSRNYKDSNRNREEPKKNRNRNKDRDKKKLKKRSKD